MYIEMTVKITVAKCCITNLLNNKFFMYVLKWKIYQSCGTQGVVSLSLVRLTRGCMFAVLWLLYPLTLKYKLFRPVSNLQHFCGSLAPNIWFFQRSSKMYLSYQSRPITLLWKMSEQFFSSLNDRFLVTL
jgi:hypothetical protein